MPRRGFVSVRLSPQQCAASADWLRNSYTLPIPHPGMDPGYDQECREHRDYLICKFEKCARRKSAQNASRLITRVAAEWFGLFIYITKAIDSTRDAPLVRTAMSACFDAAIMRGPGRRRIDRTIDEIEALSLGSASDGYGAGHRTRLFTRVEEQRALAEDFDVLD